MNRLSKRRQTGCSESFSLLGRRWREAPGERKRAQIFRCGFPSPGASRHPLPEGEGIGETRIGLAIHVIASKLSATPTLLFDEVDAGIGGRVAEIVGRLLKKLGGKEGPGPRGVKPPAAQ